MTAVPLESCRASESARARPGYPRPHPGVHRCEQLRLHTGWHRCWCSYLWADLTPAAA